MPSPPRRTTSMFELVSSRVGARRLFVLALAMVAIMAVVAWGVANRLANRAPGLRSLAAEITYTSARSGSDCPTGDARLVKCWSAPADVDPSAVTAQLARQLSEKGLRYTVQCTVLPLRTAQGPRLRTCTAIVSRTGTRSVITIGAVPELESGSNVVSHVRITVMA